MKCDRCKKKATVHLTEIDPKTKGKREVHLCQQCSWEEGITQKHPPITELLANFVLAATQTGEVANAECDACGMTFLQFRQGGLLGCPNDYHAFEKMLTPLLERAQDGQTRHAGKVPARTHGTEQQQVLLLRLRRDMEKAVQDEDYETAARLRDQIKEMEHPAEAEKV